MPKAVLAAIVFLIGVDLIDVPGCGGSGARRLSEFVIAAITCVVVFAVGVEQGIILAVVLSMLDIIRRQYKPARLRRPPRRHGGSRLREGRPRARRACPD